MGGKYALNLKPLALRVNAIMDGTWGGLSQRGALGVYRYMYWATVISAAGERG